MKKLINFLSLLWSFLPLLTLTDDNQFDEFILFQEKNAKRPRRWRFSIINLKFGTTILYLFTFTKTDNNIVKLLSLSQPSDLEKAKESEQTYSKHVAELSTEELETEKEASLYHIQTQKHRIDTSNSKINIYTTIILTIIVPLFAIQKGDVSHISFPILIMILVLVVLYSLLNICLYIFGSIKVQGQSSSTFSDLRSSKDKKQKLVVQYWFDWQQLKNKADQKVGYVKNLQYWMIIYLISLVLFITLIKFY